MKKNILKKFFIKLAKALDLELIDQNEFKSPTLDKRLNENLSNIKKSIVLPLGEVKLTRKISSLLIIFRTNTNVEMWNQNRKRIFDKSKIEYVCRALNSVIRSIQFLKKNKPDIKVDLKIIDDKSTEENLSSIKNLLKKYEINAEIINHELSIHENVIKKQEKRETFSNLSTLLRAFEIGKKEGEDLVYFLEDDYIHIESALEEMVSSYERIASQLKKDLFICPADYPFLYMDNEKTNLLIGSKRHWRTTSKSLMTFMVSKAFIDKYWDIFFKTCSDLNNPWEKYFNEIYEKEVCISPVQSLTVHITNINSGYGLSPFLDYKKLWDENDYK
tara:strand:+ start:407 stop:1399 length:993 start_codon:yes stop_codon:yes gene_type:complete